MNTFSKIRRTQSTDNHNQIKRLGTGRFQFHNSILTNKHNNCVIDRPRMKRECYQLKFRDSIEKGNCYEVYYGRV
jgi:hypothetical protein